MIAVEEPTRIDQRPNGCWAACLATITGIPLDELEQTFAADAGEAWFDENGVNLYNDMQQRLRARGWKLFHTYGAIPKGYAIACGTSPRGLYHAVVVKDGELWHDPHPSRGGLLKVQEYEYLMPVVGWMT
jgi:hypothetical protein